MGDYGLYGRLLVVVCLRSWAIVSDRERLRSPVGDRERLWALVGDYGQSLVGDYGRSPVIAHERSRSQSLVGDYRRSTVIAHGRLRALTVAIARGRLRALTVAHRHSLVFDRGRLRTLTSEKIKFDVASEKSVTVNIARRATYKRQRSTVIAHDRCAHDRSLATNIVTDIFELTSDERSTMSDRRRQRALIVDYDRL